MKGIVYERGVLLLIRQDLADGQAGGAADGEDAGCKSIREIASGKMAKSGTGIENYLPHLFGEKNVCDLVRSRRKDKQDFLRLISTLHKVLVVYVIHKPKSRNGINGD